MTTVLRCSSTLFRFRQEAQTMGFFKTAAFTAMLGMTATAGIAQEVTLRFQHFV